MSPLPECNIPKHVFTIYISIKILVHLLLIDTFNCTFYDLFVVDNGLRCFLSFAGNTTADQYQPPKTVYFRFDFKDFFCSQILRVCIHHLIFLVYFIDGFPVVEL